MPHSNKIRTALVVCGPTASGKTSFALEVADLLPQANILSVDSRQVYKDLDIVTGKDIPVDLPEKIQFFGVNLFDIDTQSNLAEFIKYSSEIITETVHSNTPLIIVGGTGLYLKAITQNLSDAVIPQNEKLREEIEDLPLEELKEYLLKTDPEKYNSLNNSDVNNPRRLIRAIEISISKLDTTSSLRGSVLRLPRQFCDEPDEAGGNPTRQSHASNNDSRSTHSTIYPPLDYLWIGFMPDKDKIVEAIHQRVIDRLANGAVGEVKKLLKKNPNTKLPIYTSLGVSQILSFLQNKISETEMINLWEKAEIDYARRQIVWFKKQPGIVWYDKGSNTKKLAAEIAKKLSN